MNLNACLLRSGLLPVTHRLTHSSLIITTTITIPESALIINTYGSSYAMEAALVHRRPLVGIWEGRLVHHSSSFLPHCGKETHNPIISYPTLPYPVVIP